MFKVRIITKKSCDICKSYISRLTAQNFPFETVDADDQNFQKQFDEWKISEVPVVQILDVNGILKDQLPVGTFSTGFINKRMSRLEKKS